MRSRMDRYKEPEEQAVQPQEALQPEEPAQAWQPEPYAYYDVQEPEEVYEDEPDEAAYEGRFRIAIGMFDLISTLVGIVVILVLIALLMMLVNWLRSDLLHSAILLQGGLQ